MIVVGWLQYCRFSNNMSQLKLAKMLGKSRQAVIDMENHRWKVSKQLSTELARIFSENPETFEQKATVEISQSQYKKIKKCFRWARTKVKSKPLDYFLHRPLTAEQRERALSYDAITSSS